MDAATHRLRQPVLRRVLAAVLIPWLLVGSRVLAQSVEQSPGRLPPQEDAVASSRSIDSLAMVAAKIVDSLRTEGYFFARVDRSAGNDLVVEPGPRVRLGAVDIVGVDIDRSDRLRAEMTTHTGDVFDLRQLEVSVERMLAEMERQGRPLASARIEEVESSSASADMLGVTIRVNPGPPVRLKRIELPGAERTASIYVGYLAELKVGRWLTDFDPVRIRRSVEDSGLFESVGPPTLAIDADSTAVLRIPLEEKDPGTFDLVLGYLPPANGAGRGSIVGNGRLALNNLFGRGRSLSLRLHRLPRQVSRVDAAAADPYVLGMPIGVHVSFHGLEQDSTYGKRSYAGEISYHLAPGMDLVAGARREATGPGSAGLVPGTDGRQVVPHADAWFLGIGARVSTVDRSLNPSQGLYVDMYLESGRKERAERRGLENDATRRPTLLEQRRLRATGRYFAPTFDRQVLVVGGDAAVLLSDEYDRSDLFRVGGAASLRGYDEDRFLGAVFARALVEYRFIIDPRSHAYAFLDLGYVDRPETPDLAARRDVYPGYGIGIQFDTGVGLVNISAALNPSAGPTDARIHAGLSFGL